LPNRVSFQETSSHEKGDIVKWRKDCLVEQDLFADTKERRPWDHAIQKLVPEVMRKAQS
jgi:hypothetical protein